MLALKALHVHEVRQAWWTGRLTGAELPDLERVLAAAAGRDTVEQDPEQQQAVALRIAATFAHLPEA